MINQASWCLHVLYTDGFKIEGSDIRALEYIPSSDGIDIDSSSDIYINNVRIEAHDDCISIKSGKDEDGRRVARPSENILIENCHFAYGHGGVAMGSEISGCIRNVTIRKCVMDNENWSPLRFKSQPSRGGIVENITFEDIEISGARAIFDINMEWRMVPPLKPAVSPLTRLRNIRFKNVRGEAKSVGQMYGFKDAPFGSDSFYFENVQIKAERGLSIRNIDGVNFDGLILDITEGEKIYKRE
jgi:polygalacturonase